VALISLLNIYIRYLHWKILNTSSCFDSFYISMKQSWVGFNKFEEFQMDCSNVVIRKY